MQIGKDCSHCHSEPQRAPGSVSSQHPVIPSPLTNTTLPHRMAQTILSSDVAVLSSMISIQHKLSVLSSTVAPNSATFRGSYTEHAHSLRLGLTHAGLTGLWPNRPMTQSVTDICRLNTSLQRKCLLPSCCTHSSETRPIDVLVNALPLRANIGACMQPPLLPLCLHRLQAHQLA